MPLLRDAGHSVTGVIRNPEHEHDIEASGGKPLLLDVETALEEDLVRARTTALPRVIPSAPTLRPRLWRTLICVPPGSTGRSSLQPPSPLRNQPEPSTSQGSFPRRRFTGWKAVLAHPLGNVDQCLRL